MRLRHFLYFVAFTFFLGAMAGAQTSQPQQCSALIKNAGPKLQIIRSGDLIGDGAREYVAAQRMELQPKKGFYISRLLVVRTQAGHCAIVLDVGKDGPKNPKGYVGIEYIDDSASFYGYKFEFGTVPKDPEFKQNYKCLLFFDWLNNKHEPEGEGLIIAWNETVGRFQEVDSSWDFFKPEVVNPSHHYKNQKHKDS
jgi:hypothetical protein